MSAGSRVGGVIVGLIFACTFGAVGLFAAYAMGATLYAGWSAEDWVRVRADVLKYDADGLAYRYQIAGREFTGDKMQVGLFVSSEVDGDIHERLVKAVADKTPVTVFVNPANPAQSAVDPQMPWMLILILSPFALAFGGIGVGALYLAVTSATGSGEKKEKAEDKKKEEGGIPSQAGAAAGFLWVFAFLWNAIAFPIAGLVVVDAWRDGEWGALFVLIFPLVGVLVLLGAIMSTINWIRRGGARMHLQDTEPALGGSVAGFVQFARGVKAGDIFKTMLVCIAPGSAQGSAGHAVGSQNLRVTDVGGSKRLSFKFDTPEDLPKSAGIDTEEETAWRLQLFRTGEQHSPTYEFPFEMQPNPSAVAEAEEEDEEAEEEAIGDSPLQRAQVQGLDGVVSLFGRMGGKSGAEVEKALKTLSPDQKEALAKAAQYGPLIRKLIFWIVGIVVLFQVIGVAVVFLTAQ